MRPRNTVLVATAGALLVGGLGGVALGVWQPHRTSPAVPQVAAAPTSHTAQRSHPRPSGTPRRLVVAAPPLRLTVPAAGIDAAVTPYTAEEAARGVDGITGKPCLADGTIVCIDPLSADEVSWQVGGVAGVAFGSQPGDNTTGTVYLYGHTVAGGGGVFARIATLHNGDQATVVTANGTLSYRVQRIVDASKAEFASTPEAVDQVPGRLLLISCDHGPGATLVNGGYSTRNVVVVLQRDRS